jgi:hypothetical protein
LTQVDLPSPLLPAIGGVIKQPATCYTKKGAHLKEDGFRTVSKVPLVERPLIHIFRGGVYAHSIRPQLAYFGRYEASVAEQRAKMAEVNKWGLSFVAHYGDKDMHLILGSTVEVPIVRKEYSDDVRSCHHIHMVQFLLYEWIEKEFIERFIDPLNEKARRQHKRLHRAPLTPLLPVIKEVDPAHYPL